MRRPNRTLKFEVLSLTSDHGYECVERGYGDHRISTYYHASIEKWHAEKLLGYKDAKIMEPKGE